MTNPPLKTSVDWFVWVPEWRRVAAGTIGKLRKRIQISRITQSGSPRSPACHSFSRIVLGTYVPQALLGGARMDERLVFEVTVSLGRVTLHGMLVQSIPASGRSEQ